MNNLYRHDLRFYSRLHRRAPEFVQQFQSLFTNLNDQKLGRSYTVAA